MNLAFPTIIFMLVILASVGSQWPGGAGRQVSRGVGLQRVEQSQVNAPHMPPGQQSSASPRTRQEAATPCLWPQASAPSPGWLLQPLSEVTASETDNSVHLSRDWNLAHM